MNNYFFESNFARYSKFKWDFIRKIRSIDKWNALAKNFEKKIDLINNNSFHNSEKIPKKIHQIWLGSKLPKKYSKWCDSWKRHNPEWEYKLWTDKDINLLQLKNRKLFDYTQNKGLKSDLARYEILYQFGGIYIDTDFECLKKIPDFLLYFDFVSCLGFNYEPEILNGFLMTSQSNIILKKIISSIKVDQKNPNEYYVMENTGPKYLTKIYFENSGIFSNYMNLILPSNYCYPYPSFLIKSSLKFYDEVMEESFATHHWEMSWMRKNFLIRVIKKLNNLFRIFRNSSLFKKP